MPIKKIPSNQVYNRISIGLLFLFIGCGKITSNCDVLPYGLVSQWDGSSVSGTTALDLGSGNNNGTLSSSVSLGSGRFSTSFGFDGLSSVISIPNNSNLTPSAGFTLAAWVKGNLDPATHNPLQTLVSKWGYQGGAAFVSKANWVGVNTSTFSGTAAGLNAPWSTVQIQSGTATFDGRYIYIADQGNGKIARFDTQGSLSSPSNWQVINLNNFPGKASDGITSWTSFGAGSYWGGAFDGRYVYFLTGGSGGRVLRLDNQGVFTSPQSWQGVDISAFSGKATDGVTSWSSFNNFDGGAFDGRYVYLVPLDPSAAVARYDTQNSFSTVSGWQGVNIAAFPGKATDGVTSWSTFTNNETGTFDGRYVYLSSWTGKVARFDTQGTFVSLNSWQGVNVPAFPGNATDGVSPWSTFAGGISVFDGRYAYFGGDSHLFRFDTTQTNFAAQSNWQGVNIAAFAGTATDGVTLWSAMSGGYNGGGFDGRYVYFSPFWGPGMVPRYDTLGNFNTVSGWQGINISNFSGKATDGVTSWSSFGNTSDTAFDGRYFYFVGNGGAGAGQISAFDTSGNLGSYNLKYSTFINDGLASSKGGMTFTINTGNGVRNVQAYPSFTSGTWNHVAATYDGSSLNFYFNGTLLASQAATGTLTSSTSKLTLGSLTQDVLGLFNGSLEKIQIFNVPLSSSSVQVLSQGNICK